jgi:hypothetical protein
MLKQNAITELIQLSNQGLGNISKGYFMKANLENSQIVKKVGDLLN